MRDLIEMLGMTVLIFLVFMSLLFSVAFVVDYTSCAAFSRVTGYDVTYDFNCYVKVDGKWVPKDFVYGTAAELRIKEGN